MGVRLVHDPKFARTVFNVARPRGSKQSYVYWLNQVRQVAEAAGIELIGINDKLLFDERATITISLPAWLKEMVYDVADDLGLSVSEFIRLLVVEFFQEIGVVE